MEFLDNSTKTVPFSEIKVGGIFKVNDNYYMKITPILETNCVRLNGSMTGVTYLTKQEDMVTKIKLVEPIKVMEY